MNAGQPRPDILHQARQRRISIDPQHRRCEIFLKGMSTFFKKEELLAELTDGRFFGLERVRGDLSYIRTVQDVEEVLVVLLNNAMTQEKKRTDLSSAHCSTKCFGEFTML
jgi:hypothetical protein